MTSALRTGSLAVVCTLLVAAAALPQEKGKQAPDEKSGLKAGEKAPNFTLKDQDGKDRTLDEFVKKGKVALVFYRSADW